MAIVPMMMLVVLMLLSLTYDDNLNQLWFRHFLRLH